MKLLDFTEFKTLKDLQDYANKQYNTIAVLDQKIKDLEAKNKHLESLLNNKVTVLNSDSEQEEICRVEINRLYQKSLREPLEFQEVKILETLSKILLNLNGKEIDDKKQKATQKAIKSLTPKELIDIALQKTPDEEDSEAN
jgi:predicted MPP superfamily phosphohydrolase